MAARSVRVGARVKDRADGPADVAGAGGALRRPAGNGLVLSDRVRAGRMELDFLGVAGDAGLAGVAGGDVAGLAGRAGAGPAGAVAGEGGGGGDLERERGGRGIGLLRGKEAVTVSVAAAR